MNNYLIIDWGGTYIRFAHYQNNQVFNCKTILALKNPTLDDVIELLRKQIQEYQVHFDVLAMAICGVVYQGVVHACYHYPCFVNLNLAKKLESVFHIPCFVENDAKLAAKGQSFYYQQENLIYLTLSTGIGCGVVQNGKIVTGARGFAGEITNIPLSYKYFHRIGDLGGNDIIRQLSEKGIHLQHSGEIFTNQHPVVVELKNEYIQALIQCCTMLVECYDPTMLVLGGGMMKSHSYFFTEMKKQVEQYAYQNIQVQMNKLDEPGILGTYQYAKEKNYDKSNTN